MLTKTISYVIFLGDKPDMAQSHRMAHACNNWLLLTCWQKLLPMSFSWVTSQTWHRATKWLMPVTTDSYWHADNNFCLCHFLGWQARHGTEPQNGMNFWQLLVNVLTAVREFFDSCSQIFLQLSTAAREFFDSCRQLLMNFLTAVNSCSWIFRQLFVIFLIAVNSCSWIFWQLLLNFLTAAYEFFDSC